MSDLSRIPDGGGSWYLPDDKPINGRLLMEGRHYPADNPLIITTRTDRNATIDGKYATPGGKFAVTRLPDGTPQNSNKVFIAHDGRKHQALGYVWAGLIHLKDCSNIHIINVDITQSRGGGLVLDGCQGIKYIGGEITHNRHAAFRVIDSKDIELAPRRIHENANFAQTSRSGREMNWPVIGNVTHGSQDVLVRDAWVYGNFGEGLGSGQRIKNLVWENVTVGPNMAMGVYMHEGEGVTLRNSIVYHDQSIRYNRGGKPSPLVVTNREMLIAQGDSGGHVMENCLLLPRSDSVAIDVWANQGRLGETGQLRIRNNIAISRSGLLLRSRGNVADIHTDTEFSRNVFMRLDGKQVYDDHSNGKSPIDGPTVRFVGNTWSSAPPKSMRSDDDTIQMVSFVNPTMAEDIPPEGIPKAENYLVKVKEPNQIEQVRALAQQLQLAADELAKVVNSL